MGRTVSYDDLEYTPDGWFLLDGLPFTGTTEDYYEGGQMQCQARFVEGRQHGVTRGWHRNGTLAVEIEFANNAVHGTDQCWFEDGALESRAEFEFGILLKKEVRSRAGAVVERYELAVSHENYKTVLKKRNESKSS